MMPKAVDKTSHKLAYPSGCKEINEELTKDELVKRLKMLARAFQDMGQDEPSDFKQLSLYLASEYFMDHASKDVRLLVACCVADIFRIFAPEAPYTDPEHLKEIFLFLTQQLRGLEDPESPTFKRYFYLLENLAWVKSFNICIELEENQDIFCSLYKLIFTIVNEKHSNKVVNFMLDMMCPLISEADAVSQELLDIILTNIIEPFKSDKKHAYNLAKDLLRRTANAIEPYIQTFFNNALMLGKNSESDVSNRLYDLIYELNQIAPTVLLAVLPQLEFKLKSSDEGERKAVTKLLAKMFSDPDSDLATQNKPLWLCFLGRFNDIDITVRRTCVQSAQEFIVNHPELAKDIGENLNQRQHDPDENVRAEVVKAIIDAAKKEYTNVTDEMLQCVKERTLDKKYKIRKEALQGLGQIFKRCTLREDIDKSEVEKVAWIKDKVLHAYYRSGLEDRVLVERLLNSCLVPYSLEPDQRMKRLYVLYSTVDPHAVKALQEIFRLQLTLRNVVRTLIELHSRTDSTEMAQLMMSRLIQLARNLPESSKAQEYMKKFNKIIREDARIRGYLSKLVSPDCTCKKAEECVKEILKKMGNPIPQNYLYTHVKMLLERIAPVMIDSEAIKALLTYIEDAVNGLGEICDDVPNATENGMKLLQMLSSVYPGAFDSEEVFTQLISFAKHDDDIVSDMTMQIFCSVGENLSERHPEAYTSLLPILQRMAKLGTPKQAKHAIRCVEKLCKNKDKIFAQIFEHVQKNMDLDSPNFLTAMVAMGHISYTCPDDFSNVVKGIVSKFVVKELLMQDRGMCRPSSDSWYSDHLVSEETLAKLQALKMMVRWLLGVKNNSNNSCSSTLRLLHTLVLHEGDLMEKGQINKAEMARLRLAAGCSMLKLAQESCYSDLVTLEQFQTLALLLNDPCYQVRLRFAQKLHKALLSLRLPLQYMSIFSLAANDPLKERRGQMKQFLVTNIHKRREYLKQHTGASARIFVLLPDYVLPYTIHLLAHDPDLRNHNDVETLKNIRECLWFIMEPLITKNESYSFSFYKKLIENIKQTKDAQCPKNQEANMKMYAICDLAWQLVLTKTANFVLNDFPAEAVLPSKLFTQPDPNYSNTKVYLPKELVVQSAKGKKNAGLSLPVQIVTTSATVTEKKLNGSRSPSQSDAGESASSRNSSPVGSPKGSPPHRKRASSGEQKPGRGRPRTKNLERSPGEVSAASRATRSNSSASSVRDSSKTSSPTSPGAKKSPRREASKEDRPPRQQTSGRRSQSQGKITDFMKRTALSNQGNKASSSKNSSKSSSSKDSDRASSKSPVKTITQGQTAAKGKVGTRSTRSGSSVSSPSTRKRAPSPDSSPETSPTKRARISPTKSSARASVRATIKVPSPALSSDSGCSGSGRSSPRKKQASKYSLDSPSKRTRGRIGSSGESSTIPSPSSKSSSPTSTPKKKQTTVTSAAVKRKQPGRGNVRRGDLIANGTSDGEEGTPDSYKSSSAASPGKKRTAALVSAIQKTAATEPDRELNVRRGRKKAAKR